jgi:hypothetical protein
MTTDCSCVVIDLLKMFALFAAKTKYNVLEIDKKYLKDIYFSTTFFYLLTSAPLL